MSSLEINIPTENLGVTFDPVPAEVFDLLNVRIRNARLVGKIETQFGGGNERPSLVDVVSKDLPEGPVENMSSGVIIPERPSAQLDSKVNNQPFICVFKAYLVVR